MPLLPMDVLYPTRTSPPKPREQLNTGGARTRNKRGKNQSSSPQTRSSSSEDAPTNSNEDAPTNDSEHATPSNPRIAVAPTNHDEDSAASNPGKLATPPNYRKGGRDEEWEREASKSE